MTLWTAARTSLLTLVLGSVTVLTPIATGAQDASADPAYTYDHLHFTNPSAVQASGSSGGTPAPASTPTVDGVGMGAMLGDPDAPVTLQIYADYQCPHCRVFHHEIEPRIVDDYVRGGKVRLEFIDFPVIGLDALDELSDDSKESVQAAEAAMCAAEQESYMPYREALYAGDLEPNSGALSDVNLVTVARELELDTGAFTECLSTGRYEEGIIAGSLAAFEMGVQGTPTMAIDGEILPLTRDGYDGVRTALDDAIENAG